jgi:hypothetical protein
MDTMTELGMLNERLIDTIEALSEAVSPEQKDMSKRVRAWAKKVGIKGPRVHGTSTKGDYVELRAPMSSNPDGVSPAERTKIVKSMTNGRVDQSSYGNVQKHIVALGLSAWEKFLAQEGM